MSEFKESKKLKEIEFDGNIYQIGEKIRVTRRMADSPQHPLRDYEGVLVSVIEYMPASSDKTEIDFILDTNQTMLCHYGL